MLLAPVDARRRGEDPAVAGGGTAGGTAHHVRLRRGGHPAAFSEHVLTALDASAHHVLLTTPDVPALKNLRVALDVLDMLSYPPEIRSVVLNRAEAKLRLSQEDVERVIRAPVAAHIPSSRAVPISTNKGVPITLANPRHPVSKAITAFVRQRLLPRPRPARTPRRQQAAGGMSLSERLARQAGGQQTVRPNARCAGPRRPAAPTRSPDVRHSVHDALLDTLGPKLYDVNLSERELEQRVDRDAADGAGARQDSDDRGRPAAGLAGGLR